MDELYVVVVVAGVFAAMLGYLLENRRDNRTHEQMRDLYGYFVDHEQRLAALEHPEPEE